MSRCKYVAKLVIRDTSDPISLPYLRVIEGEALPEVTKQVRKLVKLVHGNLIRTALIEDGNYRDHQMGRKKSNADMEYDINIFVVRGVA